MYFFMFGFVEAQTLMYRNTGERNWRKPIWPEDPRYDHALAERTRRERQGDGATEVQ